MIIGGFKLVHPTRLASTRIYDIRTRQFTPSADLSYPRSHGPCGSLTSASGDIIVVSAGGQTHFSATDNRCEKWTEATGNWQDMGTVSGWGAIMVNVDNRLLLIGNAAQLQIYDETDDSPRGNGTLVPQAPE